RLVREEDWARTVVAGWEDDAGSQACEARYLRDCFRYAVLEDAAAGERMRKRLLRVLRSPVPRGGAQWLTVLRYDLLHDQLDAETHAAFAQMARTYIRNAIETNAVFDPTVFNDSRNYSRYDARSYTRSNWLPNIIAPRKFSANLLALVLRDEELIRRTWDAYGSFRWYLDAYLADEGFYCEEFGKMGSTPGAMLLYCLGCERLGLDELGFGYRGEGGASVRGHIRSLIRLGYPAVDLGSQRPHLPMVTIGDLRSGAGVHNGGLPTPAFQQCLVRGHLPDGTGGDDPRWRSPGAWGGEIRGDHPQWDGYSDFTPKRQLPLWFELAHTRWPEDGYGWFLAQMRPPEAQRYIPSLFFGCPPLAPGDVAAPPAPSAVWSERGLALLRHDNGPGYWTGPGPAVGLRLASAYAHSVRDCFALTGYYAFNRPIYLNRQVTPGYARDWSRSIQSHCGIAVDPAPPDSQTAGRNMNAFTREGPAEPAFTDAVTVRDHFTPGSAFVAARSDAVYPGVAFTRALLLTDAYLVDVSRLVDTQPHRYVWLAHALGLADEDPAHGWHDAALPAGLMPLAHGRRRGDGDQVWRLTVRQARAPMVEEQALPASWYERGIGVRVHLISQPGLQLFHARTPDPVIKRRGPDGKRVRRAVASEVGGSTIVAAQQAAAATFAVVHEPFRDDAPRIRQVDELPAPDDTVVLRIIGEGIDDLVAIAVGDATERERTVALDNGSIRFRGHCWCRFDDDALRAAGAIDALDLDTAVRALQLDGRTRATSHIDGRLHFPAR
ncbi:MAG: hypothetical protein ACOCYV_02105, partial [Planctomycetota bacterium]